MSFFYQLLHIKMIRYIYGRSPFKTIVILITVALTLLFLSKLQIFKIEQIQSNNIIDSRYNPKIIHKVKLFKLKPTVTVSTHNASTTVTVFSAKSTKKMQNNPEKLFSGKENFRFNVTFDLIKDNLVKVALNDILLKGLNENSQKLHDSLKDKPFDYDKNARFCACSKISQPCVCCVTLAEENIGLTKSLCTNITYLPKRKAARVSMQYGDSVKSNYDVLINIDNPPSVCLSEFIKFDKSNLIDNLADKLSVDESLQKRGIAGNFTLDICFQSKNLTYNVNIDAAHRTEFRGCSNINVNLNNMMIHVYPLGCFKAGHDSKSLQIQKVANGIP